MEEELRERDADDTAELARKASRDLRELVRRETDTLKDEIAENLRHLKRPAYEVGLAAVLGFSAFGMLLSSFGSRRRGVLLLTSTALGLVSYVVGARAVRTAVQSVSFSRTAQHVERAIDAAAAG